MTASPVAQQALAALALDGVSLVDGAASVPAAPGLYAVRGSAWVWRELGLGDPPGVRPLYVGKAERSLVSRDVKTHFGTGKTGQSTLRRSVGALLADQLQLVPQPRNPAKPGYFSTFAFEPEGDARLTQWMLDHLRLATWAPAQLVVLDDVETEVLGSLLPPLNLDKVRTPWKQRVSSCRRVMASRARLWTP